MPEPKITSICVVARSQAWFSASVTLDTLSTFNVSALDQFPMPRPNTVNFRSWLGKGPIDCKIGESAALYFTHGETPYPTFTWPSFSPKGSAAKVTKLIRNLVADERTAIFCLEVGASVPVAPEFSGKTRDGLNASQKLVVTNILNRTREIINNLAGAYALYQYPLVWKHLDERHQWMIVDMTTKTATGAFEEFHPDNWVPFRLDAHTKICTDGTLQDEITKNATGLMKEEFRQILLFLKDSMWQTDIRTRFLLQFWILELLAEKYSDKHSEDKHVKEFIRSLEEIVREKFKPFEDYFKQRKGELTRLTLSQKVQACFQTMRIKYDETLFKRAKAVRDSLSHGSDFAENDLRETELYLREIVRHMIRRDFEMNGIFLNGETKTTEPLEEIIPSYPDESKRRKAEFGPI